VNDPERKPQRRASSTPSFSNVKAVVLSVALLAAIGALVWGVRRARRGPVTPPAASGGPPPSAADAKSLSPPRPADSARRGTPTKAKIEARLNKYLEETRYPPSSRPISQLPSYRFPDTPPPVSRSDTGGKRRVEQHERQDMYYVAEGETATVFVDFSIDGELVKNAEHVNGSLAKIEGTPRVPGAGVANVTFHDDGVSPDEKAHDGTVTASVPFPKDAIASFVGDMMLSATLRSGDTLLFTTFGFMYTGHPPAHFTRSVRETIENGSLVLYVGIDVERESEYVMRARLYDNDRNPLLFMSADGSYGPSAHEIRFVAFGRALRDLGVKSPFSLRDVEGFVNMPEGHPDRQKVPTWPGPYMTRHYAAADFSDDEWMSPEKQRFIDQMRRNIVAAPE